MRFCFVFLLLIVTVEGRRRQGGRDGGNRLGMGGIGMHWEDEEEGEESNSIDGPMLTTPEYTTQLPYYLNR